MKTNKKVKTTSAFSDKTSSTSAQPSHAAKKLLLDVDQVAVEMNGLTVLEDISFCIHSGEFVGLIGPNGAGKTTLLRVLLGIMRPTQGVVAKSHHTIGYVPQRGNSYDSQVPLSVREVVDLGSYGDRKRSEMAIADVHMEKFAAHRYSQLSGGQQQRVLIAKALAGNPSVLLLDEPTTGIDERSQAAFFDILATQTKKDISIIMVSHDVDAVLSLVTRVICLNRSLLYDGSPEHFEADTYLPKFYDTQHIVLHHTHGGYNA